MSQQSTPNGWTVNTTGGSPSQEPFATVRVTQPTGPRSGQLTLAGFLAVLSYANTYFSGAGISASNTDARLPYLQITTSSVVMHVLTGDADDVATELVTLLQTAGNIS